MRTNTTHFLAVKRTAIAIIVSAVATVQLSGLSFADTKATRTTTDDTAKVDVAAYTVSHNAPTTTELSQADEDPTGPGAFVPLNSDDDNYNGTPDKDDGAVDGETDLLKIIIHKVDPLTKAGNYTLTIPNCIKIWSNSDKTGAIDGAAPFDAKDDHVWYVEGVSAGSGNLVLNWQKDDKVNTDTMKITVFEFQGAQNVPDYSIHRYKVTPPLTGSKWIEPTGGSINTGPNTSDVTIKWGEGTIHQGKAAYQVNASYIWDLEVNVVKVTVEKRDGGPTFASPHVESLTTNDANKLAVSSGTTNSSPGTTGFIYWAKVSLSGPTEHGVANRGVKHIEVGFFQDVTVASDKAVWGTKTIHSTIHGNTYPDRLGSSPIYYSNEHLEHYLFKPTDDTDLVKTIFGADMPNFEYPKNHTVKDANNVNQGGALASVNSRYDFTVYVSARTDDDINGSADIYTARASTTWSFETKEVLPVEEPLTKTKVIVATTVVNGATVNATDWSAVTSGKDLKSTHETLNHALGTLEYSILEP